jgi:indolepyruvate ferredoxin oxidoreductase beta subunit
VNLSDDIRPVTLQISAIGGEGGGVLSTWVIAAAQGAGYPVQSTSIPGVAQRTGATIYYLEIFPVLIADLGDKRPVMAVYPGVGDVDIMLATEFAEAARAISNGFVTPGRTLLIASTHRVFAIDERSAMGDGRYDPEKLLAAARKETKQALLADLKQLAEKEAVSLNAVLLGALAGCGRLPMAPDDYRAAIESTGIAVPANLKGFEIGLVHQFEDQSVDAEQIALTVSAHTTAKSLEDRVASEFPACTGELLLEGVRRLASYQDAAYASRYLDLLIPVWLSEQEGGGDGALTAETGRHLALRLSYEDVIRVAQLKAAPDRIKRIRGEIKAQDHEPVIVVEYFKPGIDELCSILPPVLARPLLNFFEVRGWRDRACLGLKIRSNTIFGYARLRLLAGLRRWRRGTYRFQVEQAQIENWLRDVMMAAGRDMKLAHEVTALARLIKGYGDTYRRGGDNFDLIRERLVRPALDGTIEPGFASDAIANAAVAALADPEGGRLRALLDEIGAAELRDAAE